MSYFDGIYFLQTFRPTPVYRARLLSIKCLCRLCLLYAVKFQQVIHSTSIHFMQKHIFQSTKIEKIGLLGFADTFDIFGPSFKNSCEHDSEDSVLYYV